MANLKCGLQSDKTVLTRLSSYQAMSWVQSWNLKATLSILYSTPTQVFLVLENLQTGDKKYLELDVPSTK